MDTGVGEKIILNSPRNPHKTKAKAGKKQSFKLIALLKIRWKKRT